MIYLVKKNESLVLVHLLARHRDLEGVVAVYVLSGSVVPVYLPGVTNKKNLKMSYLVKPKKLCVPLP